jgi:hypothetical protein
MLAAHGEPQRGLLSNGYASLRDAVRAGFLDPCEPPMEVDSPTFHAKKKGHVNDLRKCRRAPLRVHLRVTARQWCNVAQETSMVPSQ